MYIIVVELQLHWFFTGISIIQAMQPITLEDNMCVNFVVVSHPFFTSFLLPFFLFLYLLIFGYRASAFSLSSQIPNFKGFFLAELLNCFNSTEGREEGKEGDWGGGQRSILCP